MDNKQALGDDTIMNNYLLFGGDSDDDAGLTAAEAAEVMAPTPVLDGATATRVAREAYEAYCAVNDDEPDVGDRNMTWPSVDGDGAIEFLTLPSGEVLKDAWIHKNYMQDVLGVDPAKLFQTLLAIENAPSNEDIPFRPDGSQPRWIRGDHPGLHYRGHALKRHKMWFQGGRFEEGLRTYRYTGWQHKISYATHALSSVPSLHSVSTKVNADMGDKKMKKLDHWIVTTYEDENDYIGFHSDKAKDFDEESYFVVMKLGAPRKFEFRMKKEVNQDKEVPFFSKVLSAGTAVFVRANGINDANSIVQHGVPPMDEACGPSGSIVGRAIKTVIPWDTVHANIAASERAKQKRLAAKKRKKESAIEVVQAEEKKQKVE